MSLTAFNRMRRNKIEAQKVNQEKPQIEEVVEVDIKTETIEETQEEIQKNEINQIPEETQEEIIETNNESVELTSNESLEETPTRRTSRRHNNSN